MSIQPYDVTESLFREFLILPNEIMKSQELWKYRTNKPFENTELQRRWKMCPSLFRVGHNLVPGLNYFYLNIEQRGKILVNFPELSLDDYEDIVEFLDKPTFYLIENREDVDGEDVLGNEFNDCDFLFMYIQPGKQFGNYNIYSIEELIQCFIVNLKFVDPHSTGKVFDNDVVNRLYRLIYKLTDPSDSHDKNIIAEGHMDVIVEIYSGIGRKHEYINRKKEFIQKNKKIFANFLHKILHIAMYMRRWSGIGLYPLKSMNTNNKVNEKKLLSLLWKFVEDCKQKQYSGLENLPLFEYDVTDKEFLICTDKDVGTTIIEKIMVVLKNDNTSSCIRMSSNLLAATVWYYWNHFFNISLFNITEMGDIQ